ncbi:MAG: YbaB/EbfC family nucleoid-associated protein [Alphaproteobacteria bacterium]|nr:YbaB/EbfC family nucleoid-associated protein [Alphaproteobacteria bacterium]
MNMMSMLKKAQDMQKGLQQAQAELAKATVEGSSGGGAVTVTMTGDHTVQSVKLQPAVVDPAELETLEDLLKVAYTDALNKANALAKQKMSAVTGGLGIPGLGF